MNSLTLNRTFVGIYLALFFAFLFGPLIIMVLTAFNSSAFPRVFPWECFTFEWFSKLAGDQRLQTGLLNSAVIGAGVVLLSVAIGLAGALFLTQINPGARSVYYTIVTSPILMPGVVIGISTILFWDRFAQVLGFKYGSFLYDGIFLTILGQSSFIASYCMLVMIARLQRFDTAQMEAAYDLGATGAQAFRKVLLPFLRPAIFSAAILAFLASFENYNTTVFTISHYHTFTTVIAQKVRLGLDPSISAVAFIIILLTLIGALFHEGFTRRGELALARRLPERRGVAGLIGGLFWRNPAMILGAMVVISSILGLYLAWGHSAEVCKADLLQQKLERQREYQRQLDEQRRKAAPAQPGVGAPSQGSGTLGPGTYGDVFNPSHIRPGTPATPAPAPAPAAPSPAPGPEGSKTLGPGTYGDVFSPGNLGISPPKPPEPQQPSEPPQQP